MLREASLEALQPRLVGTRNPNAKKLLAQIAGIHIWLFPVAKTSGGKVRDFPWERPKDAPVPEPHFCVDYDFEKYKID